MLGTYFMANKNKHVPNETVDLNAALSEDANLNVLDI